MVLCGLVDHLDKEKEERDSCSLIYKNQHTTYTGTQTHSYTHTCDHYRPVNLKSLEVEYLSIPGLNCLDEDFLGCCAFYVRSGLNHSFYGHEGKNTMHFLFFFRWQHERNDINECLKPFLPLRFIDEKLAIGTEILFRVQDLWLNSWDWVELYEADIYNTQ